MKHLIAIVSYTFSQLDEIVAHFLVHLSIGRRYVFIYCEGRPLNNSSSAIGGMPESNEILYTLYFADKSPQNGVMPGIESCMLAPKTKPVVKSKVSVCGTKCMGTG